MLYTFENIAKRAFIEMQQQQQQVHQLFNHHVQNTIWWWHKWESEIEKKATAASKIALNVVNILCIYSFDISRLNSHFLSLFHLLMNLCTFWRCASCCNDDDDDIIGKNHTIFFSLTLYIISVKCISDPDQMFISYDSRTHVFENGSPANEQASKQRVYPVRNDFIEIWIFKKYERKI